jgi:hypothetical protein
MIPPSVQDALLSFAKESNLFLNPTLLTTEEPLDEGDSLFESALMAFSASIQSRGRQVVQVPVSTVSHERNMLKFNRMYGSKPAPLCCRGADCCVNRVRFCPPADAEGGGQSLGIYLTPAEEDMCIENPDKLDDIGEGLCLLCTRSCTSALTQHYSNYITSVDQVPRECVPKAAARPPCGR